MATTADTIEIQPTTIEISRKVKQHGGAVWHALTTSVGTAVWLGRGAVLGAKGESYHCDDGSGGVVRSFHPLEQIRLTWHGPGSDANSLIEVDVTPLADGTQLRFWHEGVPADQVDQLKAAWERRLDALTSAIDG